MDTSDAALAALRAAKRWSDLVAALEQRAERGTELADRVAALEEAMTIYRDRFANMALAMRAGERILELAPDHVAAIAFLRDAYAKRRDFEKLAALDGKRDV